MLTDTERRERGVVLASRVPAFLRRRLDLVLERAREGKASARQVQEAREAYVVSRRAVRNVKRRAVRGSCGVALVAIALLTGCASPTAPSATVTPPTPKLATWVPPLIEYRLVGDGPADVLYGDEFGHWVMERGVATPWTYRHTRIWGGAVLQVVQQGTGCLTAQIWRAGVLEDQGRICGRWEFVALSKGWW